MFCFCSEGILIVRSPSQSFPSPPGTGAKKSARVGYESEYSTFLQNKWPGFFNGSFNEYIKATKSLKKMKTREVWQSYDAWLGTRLKTTSQELNTSAVFSLNEKALDLFGGADAPNNEYNDFTIVLMRMCVPSQDFTRNAFPLKFVCALLSFNC